MVRVVFDCMVFLQGAARESGPAAACLRLAEQGFVQLCVSKEVLAEVRDVLSRPNLRRKFPSLTPERIAAFLEAVCRGAVLLEEVPSAVTLNRDPKDEKYLNLTVAAGAEVLVTRDNDLLDLREEANPVGRQLRQQYPSLRILDPVEFLRQFQRPSLAEPPSPETPSSAEERPGA
jgi:putative PIN family toxin of toxin-antitoxin system